MTDFLTKDLEQEGLFQAFARLATEVRECAEDLGALECRFGRAAIARNHNLHRMVFEEAEQGRRAILTSAMFEAARDDYTFTRSAVELMTKLQNKESEMDSLSIVANMDLSRAQAAASIAQKDQASIRAELERLQERLREHALHNSEIRETVWAITNGKCFYCEVELIRCIGDEQDRSRCFHIDHLVPKTAGGPDHLSNYVPACGRCNISKGAKSFVEFIAWRKAQQPLLTVIEGGASA